MLIQKTYTNLFFTSRNIRCIVCQFEIIYKYIHFGDRMFKNNFFWYFILLLTLHISNGYAVCITDKSESGGNESLNNENSNEKDQAIVENSIQKKSDLEMPESYSINLLWVNKTLKINQRFLSSSENEEGLKKGLLIPAIKWAMANPTATINLWYDGEFVTKDALQNTQIVLNKLMQEQNVENIEIKNVRGIPVVRNNPDIFSDQIPIYFRVDLLKPIIIVYSIENENKDSAIYTDLQVGDLRANCDRMTKEELFKPSVMKKLNSHALIFATTGKKSKFQENQFLQLIKNENMIEAIKVAIINANILRAVSALNDRTYRTNFIPELSRAVYPNILHDAYAYFDFLSQKKQVKIQPDIVGLGNSHDPWIDYNPKIHGYIPFGNIRNPSSSSTLIWDQEHELLASRESVSNLDFNLTGPSRKVDVRMGGDHSENWSNLVTRSPADGSDIYKAQYWE